MKSLVSTGIPSLDTLLGGGIPERQAVVVTGDPGTGKTILCSQIAFARAAAGDDVVLATVASESHDKLLDELGGFDFFDPERIGREIFFLSAYPWLKKGPKDAKDLLLKTMRERKAKLLFLDGMRSLRDLWQDEAKLRDFLYELNVGLSQLDAVGLLTTEYDVDTLMDYPEATTVDGIISLSVLRSAGRSHRRAQVVKLRGRPHLSSEHVMHITKSGVHIVPRLEEVTVPAERFEPTSERAAFDLAELDRLLEGGLPRKSTTLLVGSTGVGKTLLSLKLLLAGAKKEEPSMLVTYSEPVERLVHRAKNVSLDPEPLVRSGKLFLEYRSALNFEADDLMDDLLAKVRERGIRRVVIDGIGEVEESIVERGRTRAFFFALIIQLRDLGVTSLFIKEVPKIAGPDLDFSDTPVSVTAENLIFARHIELRGRLHRVLSILKMRESGYDPYVREFEIEPGGIRVLDPMQSAQGLLTGIARPIANVDGHLR
jgi:circadian clock protein KaiC